MRGNDLNSMSIDELWKLHEDVALELARKLQAEKTRLEQRLRQLRGVDNASGLGRLAPLLPSRSSEVSKSDEPNADLVRPRQATPVDWVANSGWQKAG